MRDEEVPDAGSIEVEYMRHAERTLTPRQRLAWFGEVLVTYSPATCIGCDIKPVSGVPDPKHVSTENVAPAMEAGLT
jgi:hypothetical protein